MSDSVQPSEAMKKLCLHCDWDNEADYVEGKGHRHGDNFYPCDAQAIRGQLNGKGEQL